MIFGVKIEILALKNIYILICKIIVWFITYMTVQDQPLDKLQVTSWRPNVIFDVKIVMLALKTLYFDMWKHLLPYHFYK